MYAISKAGNIFLGLSLASVVGFQVGIHIGATTFVSLSIDKGVVDVGSPVWCCSLLCFLNLNAVGKELQCLLSQEHRSQEFNRCGIVR